MWSLPPDGAATFESSSQYIHPPRPISGSLVKHQRGSFGSSHATAGHPNCLWSQSPPSSGSSHTAAHSLGVSKKKERIHIYTMSVII